ncbi:MAG TPA: hypothetical protein VK157_04860, partial [Phycisphaerales bacterium]|nr:hypothetical protein [Phycisphaerales bacterium]
GVGGGQQVGYVLSGAVTRANLWTGTAASRIELHQPAWIRSAAYDTNGTFQVGQVQTGNVFRASLWSGSADSWIDLHALLPEGFSESSAGGVFSDGNTLSIVGWGRNAVTDDYEALLWTSPIPTPGVATLFGIAGIFVARRRR